jgi:hypothetical protein
MEEKTMTLEIKSERRNLTFGSGEPAVSHEEAINTMKEFLRAEQIAEMSRHVCTACEYEYNGSCGLHRLPGQCHNATAVAEAFYNAGYRKQVEGEWLERKGERWIGSEVCETYTYYSCSICEGESLRRTNHCPNCGVKMKGGT